MLPCFLKVREVPKKRAAWPTLLGAVAGLGLLGWLLRRVNVAESWTLLTQADARLIFVPLLITLGCVPLRAWRWWAIFPRWMRPGFGACFWMLAIGNLANNLLPGRGGDLFRSFLISREHKTTGPGAALATVGLEKVLDGLVLLAMVFPLSFVLPMPRWFGRAGILASLCFGGAFALLLLLRYRLLWFSHPMGAVLRALHLSALEGRIASFVASLAEGLNAITAARQMAGLVFLTVAIWLSEGALVWGLALALRVPLSLPAAVVVSAVLGLGLAIPAAPGFLGTYEFFSVAGLTLFGIDLEPAFALAVVMHAWSFLSTAALGLIGLGVEGVNFAVPKITHAR